MELDQSLFTWSHHDWRWLWRHKCVFLIGPEAWLEWSYRPTHTTTKLLLNLLLKTGAEKGPKVSRHIDIFYIVRQLIRFQIFIHWLSWWNPGRSIYSLYAQNIFTENMRRLGTMKIGILVQWNTYDFVVLDVFACGEFDKNVWQMSIHIRLLKYNTGEI